MTVEERFWAKVQICSADECWPWTANRNSDGYGRFWDGSRQVAAHRFAYELHNGSIPQGLVTDHLCRNRGCVNPAHLEIVTPRENTLRGENHVAQRARKTHCHHGHEFTPENTYRYSNGKRGCRACRRERDKRKTQADQYRVARAAGYPADEARRRRYWADPLAKEER